MENYNLTAIKEWLSKHLAQGDQVTVRWDCGGDEAFVYPAINGEELPYEDDMHEEFAFFLIETLDIPDAGEFSMQGEGTIFAENGAIKITYHAEGEAMVDFDEETQEEITETINEPTKTVVLFE